MTGSGADHSAPVSLTTPAPRPPFPIHKCRGAGRKGPLAAAPIHRTATLNREKVLRAGLLKRLAAQRLRQIGRKLEVVDREKRTICRADTDLNARLAILASVQGIGEATSFVMLIETPEHGSIEHKAVSSLADLSECPRLRTDLWKAVHPGRQSKPPPGPPQAGARRDPVQRRHEGRISGAHRHRKAAKGRDRRRHPRAGHPRQRIAESRPRLGTRNRLTITELYGRVASSTRATSSSVVAKEATMRITTSISAADQR